MKLLNKQLISFLAVSVFAVSSVFAQSTAITTPQITGQDPNAITTAVPFLLIAPDSRAAGMGDAGVATTPDVNSMHWNPAKYAFVEKDMGVGLSYTPWLKRLVDDMSISYLSGYKRIGKNDRQAVAFSLCYFSLGNVNFTNDAGQEIITFNPKEFSVDGAYSFKLSKNLSGGIAMRYIYSNLTGGVNSTGSAPSHAGKAIAADLSIYYQTKMKVFEKNSQLSLGTNISNIGSRMSYTDNAVQNYIPINLKMGGAFKLDFDDYNNFCFTMDLNKLLVPTPPVYSTTNTEEIIAGKNPDVPVAKGIFQSFNDAPAGWKEELHEVSISTGLEYWYAKQFALRGGYFYEHPTKGNRKYFSFGVGLRLNIFGLDFAYLAPVNMNNSPLSNTIRFSLTFDFENLMKKKEEVKE